MTVPWVVVEVAIFELACIAVGAVAGLVIALVHVVKSNAEPAT